MTLTDPSRATLHSRAKEPPARGGFLIGWLTITLATALVFVAFAGPLIQNGHAAAIAERLATTPAIDTTLRGTN